MRVRRRERDEDRLLWRELTLAQAVPLLGQHHDRTAFRRFVGQRGELGRVGELAIGSPGERDELGGLAIAERDRARLVEQQGVHVAGRLDGAAGHRQHVVLHHPVHAGDPDGRQEAADGGGNQAHEQRDQDEHGLWRARIDRERLQRHHRHQEDDGQAGQQDVERDLVRRLLTRGALDQRDHAIEERLSRIGRDANLDPVREDARAAGDRRPIAARPRESPARIRR